MNAGGVIARYVTTCVVVKHGTQWRIDRMQNTEDRGGAIEP